MVVARSVWASWFSRSAGAVEGGDGARPSQDRACGSGVRWLPDWQAAQALVPGGQQVQGGATTSTGPRRPVWANHAANTRREEDVHARHRRHELLYVGGAPDHEG